jgi:hypothetical protein
MDQSPAVVRITGAYGGSDDTRFSFNRTRYLSGGSVHAPLDLIPPPGGEIILEGLVGAQSGSQTLFFRLRTSVESRIGVQRIALNPYTDQYVQIALRDPSGDPIDAGPSAFRPAPSLVASVAAQGQAPILTEAIYAATDYWDDGYTENFQSTAPLPPILELVIASGSDPSDLVASLGPPRPPGDYLLTISSSQWPQLPFRFRLLARPVEDTDGVLDFTIDAAGRFHLVDLASTADFTVEGVGRLSRVYNLGQDVPLAYSWEHYWELGYAESDGVTADNPQVADFTLSPVATVQRLSPLQGFILSLL